MILSSIRESLKPARPPELYKAGRHAVVALRPSHRLSGLSSTPCSTSSSSRSSALLLAFLALVLAFACSPVQAQNTTAVLASVPHLEAYDLPSSSSAANASGLLLSLASNVTSSLASSAAQPTAFLSFAFCSAGSSAQIFISTSSDYPTPSSQDLDADGDDDGSFLSDSDKGVWFVDVTQGYGSWSGSVTDGLWVGIWDSEGESVEVGLSTDGLVQSYSTDLPLLGDTTASHMLLHTPAFANLSTIATAQTYPNYTLPPPVFSPTAPTSPNATVYVLPTDQLNATLATTMARSACWVRRTAQALNASVAAIEVADRQVELAPNSQGWREVVVLANSTVAGQDGQGGLVPGGNYTLFVLTHSDEALRDATLRVAGAGSLAGPIWASMKRDDFPCPLAYGLSLCPAISHAVALPSTPAVLTSLPSTIEAQLTEYLESFAQTLGTWPCGRKDNRYSMVADCEDCWEAYRDWLCAVSLPRCGEVPLYSSTRSMTTTTTADGAEPTYIARNASFPRSPSLTTTLPSYDYSELPPCLSLCYRTDRLCPVFLGFRCPLASGGPDDLGTARKSYAVGDGEMGVQASRKREGVDRYGVSWCERGGEWTN